MKKVKKSLAFIGEFIYNLIVVTLIAVKREVVMSAPADVSFPWSECQVVENWRQVTVRIQSIK